MSKSLLFLTGSSPAYVFFGFFIVVFLAYTITSVCYFPLPLPPSPFPHLLIRWNLLLSCKYLFLFFTQVERPCSKNSSSARALPLICLPCLPNTSIFSFCEDFSLFSYARVLLSHNLILSDCLPYIFIVTTILDYTVSI